MSRHVLTINLRDDPAAIASYREHHRRIWPEVVESLRTAGVRQMDIHILGRRLVMVVDLADGLDVQSVFDHHYSTNGRVQEWEQLMKSLQEPIGEAAPGEWWALMEPVFELS
jgi:L-rhamnose mutarotase